MSKQPHAPGDDTLDIEEWLAKEKDDFSYGYELVLARYSKEVPSTLRGLMYSEEDAARAAYCRGYNAACKLLLVAQE